ncbi:MAG: organic solvent tolerance protein OstA [Acholeplasmataceae bacterium]|jgi:lipopolysaccharide export system protein LptA|nr:organic solvent tolerance protein OstA [Acholeplasmataceae bacterium]
MKKILILVFLLCLFPLSCLAKPVIKCDKQTFDPLTTTYYLEGNVSVDTGSRLITANRAQVELYSLEVYAEGNVNLTQDNMVFTGDTVHVYGSRKTAVVEGDINFSDGSTTITASKGSFNWATKDAVFEGNVLINADSSSFTGTTQNLLLTNKNESGQITTNKIIYNVRTKKFHE